MNSEQDSLFEFVGHPMTCGHCGAEVTVPMCPYCLHEEKSINVQLKEAIELANLRLETIKGLETALRKAEKTIDSILQRWRNDVEN